MKMQTAIKTVVDTFTKDEAQGYRSRDRQFAIEILSEALNRGVTMPYIDTMLNAADNRQPPDPEPTEAERLAELEQDRDILDWLNGQTVDVIYLDDGRIIDVRGEDVRHAILQRMVNGWPGADLEE